MYYDSEALYITSATTLQDRIARLDQCIDALLNTVLAGMGKAGTQEYMLNDGQTTIKKVYTNRGEVMAMLESMEFMKTRYINQLNGRSIRLVDAKSLYPYRNR